MLAATLAAGEEPGGGDATAAAAAAGAASGERRKRAVQSARAHLSSSAATATGANHVSVLRQVDKSWVKGSQYAAFNHTSVTRENADPSRLLHDDIAVAQSSGVVMEHGHSLELSTVGTPVSPDI